MTKSISLFRTHLELTRAVESAGSTEISTE